MKEAAYSLLRRTTFVVKFARHLETLYARTIRTSKDTRIPPVGPLWDFQAAILPTSHSARALSMLATRRKG